MRLSLQPRFKGCRQQRSPGCVRARPGADGGPTEQPGGVGVIVTKSRFPDGRTGRLIDCGDHSVSVDIRFRRHRWSAHFRAFGGDDHRHIGRRLGVPVSAPVGVIFGSADRRDVVRPSRAHAEPITADVILHETNGNLSYDGALAVLQDAAVGGMTQDKFSALTSVATALASGEILHFDYVAQIFDDVVLGNSANAWWTGTPEDSLHPQLRALFHEHARSAAGQSTGLHLDTRAAKSSACGRSAWVPPSAAFVRVCQRPEARGPGRQAAVGFRRLSGLHQDGPLGAQTVTAQSAPSWCRAGLDDLAHSDERLPAPGASFSGAARHILSQPPGFACFHPPGERSQMLGHRAVGATSRGTYSQAAHDAELRTPHAG